jgi:tRNA acetyltransferase TAN1
LNLLKTDYGQGNKGGNWRTPHAAANMAAGVSGLGIEAGDQGIWATCDMGREGKATTELKGIFERYSAELYGGAGNEDEDNDEGDDVEAAIQKEIVGLKKKSKQMLVKPVTIDAQCGKWRSVAEDSILEENSRFILLLHLESCDIVVPLETV